MDDTLLIARCKMLVEANDRVKGMMERGGGGLDWMHTHQCSFMLDKFRVIRLMRSREATTVGPNQTRPVKQLPIQLWDFKVPAIAIHKFLGVLIDQELRWKEHVNYALVKGIGWVTQYQRLVKVTGCVSAKYMWRLYMVVAVPRMLYMADIFLIPSSRQSQGDQRLYQEAQASTETSCFAHHRGHAHCLH